MFKSDSEWNHRPAPLHLLSWARSFDSGCGFPPSLADGTPGHTAIEVKQPLAERIEVEKEQYYLAVYWSKRPVATDQLVVVDPTVCETHSSLRFYLHALTTGQTWPQDHRIEEVAVAANIGDDGTVVERAGERGNKVNALARPPLKEAPTWDLYDHFDPCRLHVH